MILGSLLLTVVALALLLLGLVNGSDPALVGSIAASLLAAIAIVVGSRRAGADRLPPEAAPASGDVPADDAPVLVATGGGAAGDGAAGDGEQVVTVRDESEPIIPTARTGTDESVAAGAARERLSSATMGEPVIPAQVGAQRRDREDPADGSADGDSAVLGEPADGDSAVLGEPADGDPAVLGDSGDEEPPDEPVAQQVPAGDAARVARMRNEVLVIDGRPRYHLADCPHLLGRDGEALPVHEAVELGFTPCGLCEPDTALLAEARRA